MSLLKFSGTLDTKAVLANLSKQVGELKVAGAADLAVLGEAMAANARSRAPEKTGELKGSIKAKPGVGITGPHVDVGSFGCDHAAVVELGSRPHIIRAKNAKVLANQETGQVFGPVVNHPGTTAKPYLRPAIMEEAAHFNPTRMKTSVRTGGA